MINNHYAVFPVHERLPKYSLARELGCISKCFLQAERNEEGKCIVKTSKMLPLQVIIALDAILA